MAWWDHLSHDYAVSMVILLITYFFLLYIPIALCWMAIKKGRAEKDQD